MTLPNLELLEYKAEETVRKCFVNNIPKIEYICTLVQDKGFLEKTNLVTITVFKDKSSRTAIIFEGNKKVDIIYDANWNRLMDDIRDRNIQFNNNRYKY